MREMIIIQSFYENYKKIRLLFSIILILSISNTAMGKIATHSFFLQKSELTGNIVDTDGNPLSGVVIQIKDSNKGVVTDFDGNYTIAVNVGDFLTYSYLGFKEQSIVYSGQKAQNITLEYDIETIEDVVIIGYGKVQKKELTGAVKRVKGDEIRKLVTPSLGDAIQGKIAGVNVVSGGAPGQDAIIQIRGINSLLGDTTPLYVVDGIPQEGNPRLSPNEVESIDVLKDAASASIYGTRGANGVILVTTRSGKIGKPKFSLEHSTGIQRIISKGTPLLNTKEQLFFDNIINKNGFSRFPTNFENAFRNDFDITDIILKDDQLITNTNLNISGGTDLVKYSLSGGYFDQDGIVTGSGFQRYNIRGNGTYSKDKLWINSSIGFSTERTKNPQWGILQRSLVFLPFNDPINLDDTTFGAGLGESPFQSSEFVSALTETNSRIVDRFNFSTNVSYSLTKHLKFRAWIGGSIANDRRNRFRPRFRLLQRDNITDELVDISNPEQDSSVTDFSSRQITHTTDATLDWEKWMGKNHLKIQAGLSRQHSDFTSFEARRRNVQSNDVRVLDGAIGAAFASSTVTGSFPQLFLQDGPSDIVGTLGRVAYDYDKKYLISASVRRDASSVFSANNRWAAFPSVSAGWNISEEKFWKSVKPVVNGFKLRASYGTTGNDRVGRSNLFITLSNLILNNGAIFGADQQTIGSSALTFANNDLKWETTIQQNFGADIDFFKNKVNFSIDYYIDEKEDLLLPVMLPASSGASITTIANVGDLSNDGLEIGLKWNNNIGDFKYSVGGTFTSNNSEIKRLAGSTQQFRFSNPDIIAGDTNSNISTLTVGRPASSFFLFETDGVISTDEELEDYLLLTGLAEGASVGDLRYVDTNGDGSIDVTDKVFKGSGLPDFTVGFNFDLQYKNFDFATNWFASSGNEVINGGKANAYTRGRHRDLLFQFDRDINPSSTIPSFRGDSKTHPNFRGDTDLFIEDGSFIRLKQISFGYTLPKSVYEDLGIDKLRFYLSGQNVLTFTKYTGFDPEITNPFGNNGINFRGVDLSSAPVSAQYLFGLQLDF